MLLPMTPRTKKTAAALSGALVLASGAYALGSQAGDGSALAGQHANAARQTAGYGFGTGRSRPSRLPRRPARGLADAAKQLGVSRGQAPRRAEEAARRASAASSTTSATRSPSRSRPSSGSPRPRSSRRSTSAATSARASASCAATAVAATCATPSPTQLASQARHRRGEGPLRARRAAQERPAARPRRPRHQARRHRGEAARRAAGPAPRRRSRPTRPRPGFDRRGHRDEKLDALAKDLGVSQAKLQAALKGIRDDLKAQRDKAIDEFAADLAKELGVSKAKVDDVIDSLGHHGRRGP